VLAGHCGTEGAGQLDSGHKRKQVPRHDSRCVDAAAAASEQSMPYMDECDVAEVRLFG
jgi:hypothetical protein